DPEHEGGAERARDRKRAGPELGVPEGCAGHGEHACRAERGERERRQAHRHALAAQAHEDGRGQAEHGEGRLAERERAQREGGAALAGSTPPSAPQATAPLPQPRPPSSATRASPSSALALASLGKSTWVTAKRSWYGKNAKSCAAR